MTVRAEGDLEVAKDDMEIISAVQFALAEKVGAERYETWFATSTQLALVQGTMVVSVASPFYQDWLRRHFRGHIESACCEVLGRAVAVTFQVDPSIAARQTTEGQSAAPAAPAAAASSTGPTLRVVSADSTNSEGRKAARNGAAAEANSAAPVPRQRFASFDSFILGGSNRLAHTAARQIVEQLGSTSPLVIHGPTGVGKTHLLESIWSLARRTTTVPLVYLTAEQFTTQFIEALNGRGLPSFRRKYRELGLLIIDDLHFFAGKRATQSELLHTIDALLQRGKQIVFAADRGPTSIGDFLPELVARLQGGLACAIEPPEFETRLGIVRRMAAGLGVVAQDDVWELVAQQVTSHARALQGAIKQLQIVAAAAESPITVELATQVLGRIADAPPKHVRLADVEEAVCRSFGLEPNSLVQQANSKRMQAARTLAMWLARKHTRNALSEIGDFFGLRSHSTVVSAQKRAAGWIDRRESVEVGMQTFPADEAVRRVEKLLLA